MHISRTNPYGITPAPAPARPAAPAPAAVPVSGAKPSTAAGASLWTSGVQLTLRDVVEDGAVFYINGQEVLRHNVGPGALSVASRAAAATLRT